MNIVDVAQEHSLASRVCRIAFCFYVVFMLVGSAMPFQDADSSTITVSNPINQIVDSVIPLICLVCLWPRKSQAVDLLKQGKYLILFLLWCSMSVMWSESSLMSTKASVRIIGSTIVALSFCVHADSADEAFRYIKAVLAIYVPLTFLAIALVPGATQWEFPAWRGLTNHKNTLGEIALVSTVVWASGILKGSHRKLWCVLFAAASFVLVLGSKSTTALMTLAVIAAIGLWLYLVRTLGKPFVAAALGVCFASIALIVVNTGTTKTIFADLGKDDTFTGRTDLWDAMMRESKLHPVLGAGFGGFWTPDRDLGLYAPKESAWQPNEGHEGYLDLLNETGIVGVFLLGFMIVSYFSLALRLKSWNVWALLFVGVLIVNTMESTLFRAGSFTGWVFVLAYLSLQRDRQLAEIAVTPAGGQ